MHFGFAQKLLLLTVVPLVIGQIGTVIGVMKAAESEVQFTTREKLHIGATVVDQYLKSRVQQNIQTISVLASDYALKEVIALGDEESIRSALINHGQRVNADFAVYIDLYDSTTVITDFDEQQRILSHVIGAAQSEQMMAPVSSVSINKQAYQLFSAPVRAPTIVGYLVFGIHLNQGLIERVEKLTGLQAALVQSDFAEPPKALSLEGIVSGSSWLTKSANRHTVYSVHQDNEPYLATYTTLGDENNQLFVVLRQSVKQAMAPYRNARTSVIIFGGTILLLVAGIGIWFARTLSKPISQLTSVAEQMSAGDYNTSLPPPSNDEVGRLGTAFNSLQSAISEREANIRYQSLHDPLTQLPNRNSLIETLENLIADENTSSVALIAINLSGMQKVTSSIGQELSDDLVVQISKIINLQLPLDGMVYHTGTYEFFVSLSGENEASAVNWVNKIAQSLSSGVILSKQDILIKTHSGVAVYPEHGEVVESLIRHAQIASTDALAASEHVHCYETGREEIFERQIRIVSDLPAAIRNGELNIVYQPKIKLKDGSVYGAEALVRWRHPEFGNLSPEEFIPMAESTGSIVELTRYVVTQSIKSLREWRQDGLDFKLAINLSVRDLLDVRLVSYVKETLRDNAVPASAVTLEVTETSIMENVERAIATLIALRDLGIHTSIDDFGTGQSSLSQLQRLPLDELKVDKSFVMSLATDPMSEVLVSTTIALAHRMGLTVVAEGVEDETSARQLAYLECEVVQGYFFSKPLNKQEFDQWLLTYETAPYTERRQPGRAFSNKSTENWHDLDAGLENNRKTQ